MPDKCWALFPGVGVLQNKEMDPHHSRKMFLTDRWEVSTLRPEDAVWNLSAVNCWWYPPIYLLDREYTNAYMSFEVVFIWEVV